MNLKRCTCIVALLSIIALSGCKLVRNQPPGHDPDGPGNSENAPGHNKSSAPGKSGSAPGHNK